MHATRRHPSIDRGLKMNQSENKRYFVRTDDTFQQVIEWIAEQRTPRYGLDVTGYREIQLSYISGDNMHYDCLWGRMYDFSRTAQATLRYLMLTVTGLIQFHDPGFGKRAKPRNQSHVYIPCPHPKYSKEINYGNHLAGSKYEAQWISAHFDMLFPHFHIENRLEGLRLYEERQFFDSIVIIDIHHHVVWNLVVTLTVRKLYEAPYGSPFQLLAIPLLAVHRMEYVHQPPHPVPNYPFLQRPLDDNADVKGILDMTRNMQIK